MNKKSFLFGIILILSLGVVFAGGKKESNKESGKQVIKIAFAQDEGVCSYVDENDFLTGEEVEVWREIAKLLPEYDIKFIPTSQDDLRVGLQTGNYDGSVGDFFLTKERIEKFEIPREPLDFTWTGMLIRKEYADGVSSLYDLASKQKDGLTVAPQNSGYGSTYVLEVYNEQNPDNKLVFETTSEQTWSTTRRRKRNEGRNRKGGGTSEIHTGQRNSWTVREPGKPGNPQKDDRPRNLEADRRKG